MQNLSDMFGPLYSDEEVEILVRFELDLYRAPSITAFYSLPVNEWEKIHGKLTKYADKTHDLGELQGKHSNTKFTGQELLDGATVIREQAKIDAFKTLHPRNSYDIIDRLREIWVCDFQEKDI